MAKIVLATLNARYAHASFGLRSLLANMGELRGETALVEAEITSPRLEVLDRILAHAPKVVGLGVYVWNVVETTALVADLKALRKDLIVVLGGPEVSYEQASQPIVALADHVIAGEADLAFVDLARRLLEGGSAPLLIEAALPDLGKVQLAYDEYTAEDLAHRVVYVEASRGCPYKCEFCLSSLDIPVRAFALDRFLEAMQKLLDRGARNFKFVDRTFNLSPRTSTAILRFFLERMREGLHVHFELVPDRLPVEVRELAARFPEGSIQFEIGIQTFSPGVNAAVSRFQDDAKACDNLRFLRDETKVHVHADLLFGLPGETLETFAESFDRLLPLVPGDIQLGILKRLRGTPLVRHEPRLVFSPVPPYEILESDTVSFEDMTRMKRFARFFEVFRNSGEHRNALAILFGRGRPFHEFLAFSDWLFKEVGRTFQLALQRRHELVWKFLVSRGEDPKRVADAVAEDFYGAATPRSEALSFIEPFVDGLDERRRQNRTRAHSSVRKSHT